MGCRILQTWPIIHQIKNSQKATRWSGMQPHGDNLQLELINKGYYVNHIAGAVMDSSKKALWLDYIRWLLSSLKVLERI